MTKIKLEFVLAIQKIATPKESFDKILSDGTVAEFVCRQSYHVTINNDEYLVPDKSGHIVIFTKSEFDELFTVAIS